VILPLVLTTEEFAFLVRRSARLSGGKSGLVKLNLTVVQLEFRHKSFGSLELTSVPLRALTTRNSVPEACRKRRNDECRHLCAVAP